jgi:CRISPR-associated protein Cas1
MLARVTGPQQGNVLLRKKQYRVSDNPQASEEVARSMILGKLYNAKWMLSRVKRDHAARLDTARLEQVIGALQEAMDQTVTADSLESIRGIEGSAANRYFSVMDDLILQQKDVFFFRGRSRRPPMDAFNAMLSFCYALLANDVAAALETAGLDPYVGFLHRDRPGRTSLALDMMEELRPVFVDRFVLSLINKRIVTGEGFTQEESGAVIMDESVRRVILKHWQEKKTSEIIHPFLKEQVPWGIVPFAQALLLARYLRDDIDAYPPFFWK